MNGVVNLSVLDGWWVEGYREGAGWALPEKRTYQNQGYQDQLDAATIYNMLENEIVPLYYNKDEKGISAGWMQVVKNSIATIAPHYTMKRQLDDYYDRFYTKQAQRFAELSKDDNKVAKELASWKETVAQRWDSICVVSTESNLNEGVATGKEFNLKFVIDEQGLNDAVGVELVVLNNDMSDTDREIKRIIPFEVTKVEGNLYTFEAHYTPSQAGAYKTAVRMYPKNDMLPHRCDFAYIKWIG